MIKWFLSLFMKKQKIKPFAYSELQIECVNTDRLGKITDFVELYHLLFYEIDDKRWYIVKEMNSSGYKFEFNRTTYYQQCETWKATGLEPNWIKHVVAEKLKQ